MLKYVNEGETLILNNILKRGREVNNKESSVRTFSKEFI